VARTTVGTRHRYDIEGLRAVAVILVVLNHLIGWPRGGFVGVDVFFVISGFLITGLLIKEHAETGTFSLRRFYARRVRRLMPVALLVLVVTVVAAAVLFVRSRTVQTAIDAAWSSIFLANWHFISTGTDYFQQGQPESPLQHYWTLAVEEQFYLVWPVLLFGIFLAYRRFARAASNSLVLVRVVIVVAIVASFGYALQQSSTDPVSAYFSTATRAWELAIGAALAASASLFTRIPTAARTAMSYIGIAGIVASAALISSELPFPGPWALAPVLSTALVLAAGIGEAPRYVGVLTNAISRYIGRISYSVYLWHWPVFILLATGLSNTSAVYYVIALVLTFSLSAASYALVENPIRRSSWLETWPRMPHAVVRMPRPARLATQLLALAAVAALVVGGITVGTSFLASKIDQASGSLPTTIIPITDCRGAAAMDAALDCDVDDDLTELAASLDGFANDTQGAYGCWRAEGAELVTCSYGSQAADRTRIALVGDSHAAMLLPGLAAELEDRNWSLDIFLGYGCQWTSNGKGDCVAVREQVQQRLLTEPAYDAVVTTALRSTGGDNKAEAAAAYAESWTPIAERGTRVIAVADNPGVSEAALACLTRTTTAVADTFKCSMDRAEATSVIDPLVAAVDLVPEASLVDLNAYYCSDEACDLIIGNVIVYRDTAGHITGTFSRTLGPYLATAIDAILEAT